MPECFSLLSVRHVEAIVGVCKLISLTTTRPPDTAIPLKVLTKIALVKPPPEPFPVHQNFFILLTLAGGANSALCDAYLNHCRDLCEKIVIQLQVVIHRSSLELSSARRH